jgi:hypothetical protein
MHYSTVDAQMQVTTRDKIASEIHGHKARLVDVGHIPGGLKKSESRNIKCLHCHVPYATPPSRQSGLPCPFVAFDPQIADMVEWHHQQGTPLGGLSLDSVLRQRCPRSAACGPSRTCSMWTCPTREMREYSTATCHILPTCLLTCPRIAVVVNDLHRMQCAR